MYEHDFSCNYILFWVKTNHEGQSSKVYDSKTQIFQHTHTHTQDEDSSGGDLLNENLYITSASLNV